MCEKCIDTYFAHFNNGDQSVSLSVSENTSFKCAEICAKLYSYSAELQPRSAVINPWLRRVLQILYCPTPQLDCIPIMTAFPYCVPCGY